MIHKRAIADAFREKLRSSLQVIQDSLHQLEVSLFEETKSSAGDKYETSREMIQSEMDRLEKQKIQISQDLSHFEFTENDAFIEKGSLVELTLDKQKIHLFIGAAIGNIVWENTEIRSISIKSPLGSALLGKKVQETFLWNEKSIHILNCY
jgi:transcription elongation GreA/GreB family factor